MCLLVKETAEIETGMAEKSTWDQANIQKKLGLVWRNRKKISQIIKDYCYLPFFLLIILCLQQSTHSPFHTHKHSQSGVRSLSILVQRGSVKNVSKAGKGLTKHSLKTNKLRIRCRVRIRDRIRPFYVEICTIFLLYTLEMVKIVIDLHTYILL